jgi:hypothetical protein
MTDLMILKAGWLAALLALLPLLGRAQTEALGSAPSTPTLAVQAQMPTAGNLNLTSAQLFERLAPNPAQMPLWQAFEASLARYMALRLREVPVLASQNSATQQLTQRIGQQQNRLAALEELEMSVKPLLQSLNPTQLALANQYLPGTIPGFNDTGNCPTATPEQRRKPQTGGASQRGRGMGGGV